MNATTTFPIEQPAIAPPPARYGHRASPRRRLLSLLLALAIEVLLLLAFFTLNFGEKERPQFEGGRLTTFDVSAESQADRSATPQEQQPEQVAEVRPPRPVPPVPKPVVELPRRPLDMLIVTKEVYEASDITRLGSNAPGYVPEQRMARSGSGGRGAPGDSPRVGTAPNGEPLYLAEWYREPTDAEMDGYMTKAMRQTEGWGLIACKTAPDYRVIDCVELGQAPAGSHLAGAVRQAAWQFKVRPPRIGGKPIIGAWVRIRYSQGPPGEKERPSIVQRSQGDR